MNNTSTNLSLNNISAEETQLNSSKGKEKADLNMSLFEKLQSSSQHKLSGYSQSTKMLIASLTFVMMLFIAEQSVYYFYLSVCWSASSLSQVRTMFLSFPEIISSPKFVSDPSSDSLVSIVQDLKLKFQEDLEKLNVEVGRLQLRNQDIETETLQFLERMTDFNLQPDRTDKEEDSVAVKINPLELPNEQFKYAVNDIIKDHVEEMSRNHYSLLLEKYEALSSQFKLLTRSKDSSNAPKNSDELMKEIEKIKETISSIETNSSSSKADENSISLALAKLPVLSSIGEKLEKFESRASRLEEKLDSDINLIIENLSHNLSRHLEAEMKTHVESLMSRSGEAVEDKLLDWANSELGTKVVAFNGTKTHPEAVSSSLKVFGFSVWKQVMNPSMIIERPHEGRCWPFSGTSGSLLFKLPRKVPLKMVTLIQSPLMSSPKDIIVWDHDRWVHFLAKIGIVHMYINLPTISERSFFHPSV